MFFSPSHRACEAGFDAFGKMKCIFSIAPEESFEKVTRVFLREKHSSDDGSDSVGR